MDVEAILARAPEVALVDELAHTNVPGSRNEKRWLDVEELLGAGIDVITTVNIQHLESLNDVIERITGVTQRETIPDEVVRGADQQELVDMTPQALRRRMAHGNVYAPEKVDAALSNYFREGNLAALRELALLWIADRVDEDLLGYMRDRGIEGPWETRERILVGVAGLPEDEVLIRRAARMATRRGGELLAVHVIPEEGPARETQLAHTSTLVEDLGGRFEEFLGKNVPQALLDVARAEQVTQIVLGASDRSRWEELTSGSILNTVIRGSGPIDVHVISQPDVSRRATLRQAKTAGLSPRRRLVAGAAGAVGLIVLTVVLDSLDRHLALSSIMLLYLANVVAIAIACGRRSADRSRRRS
jgi:two-component system, OmpR family, sensor histidine kinase KdpD